MSRRAHCLSILIGALLVARSADAQGPSPRFTVNGRDIVRLDFSSTALGDFPSGIQMIDGIMDVIDWSGRRVLRASSRSTFLIQLPQVLPQDFTLEFEIVPKLGGNPEDLAVEGTPTINQGANSANVMWHRDNLSIVGGGQTYYSAVPPSFAATLPNMLTQVVIAMQGPTMKLYTNGRLMFMQTRTFARTRVLRVFLGGQDDGPNAVLLASMRVVDGVAVGPVATAGSNAGGNPGAGAAGAAPAAPPPSPLPPTQNPVPNVGQPPATTTATSTNASTGRGGPTPGTTLVQNVTVTLGPNGPIVDWQFGTAPAVYTVQRWKADDPQCCNNTSAAAPPVTGPPWQDSPPLLSGTYTYRVTATSSSGSAMAGTDFDYTRGTSSGTSVGSGRPAGTPTVSTNTTPTVTVPTRGAAGSVTSGFAVTVTMGANGPVVTWPSVPQATGYSVSRTKSDDFNCCNTSSARNWAATSPWQDRPLPMSGSYEYKVIANTPNGQMTATTLYDFTAPPVGPGSLGQAPSSAGAGNRPGVAPASTRFSAYNTTPTRTFLEFYTVPGAVGYRIRRAVAGTTNWTDVTPLPIPPPSVPTGSVPLDLIDVFPDPRQTYAYELHSLQRDGTYGTNTLNVTPLAPADPSGFTATVTGAGTVLLEWDGVPSATTYLINGPGTNNGVNASGSQANLPGNRWQHTLTGLPVGTHTWTIASAYQPGGVLTPASAWPAATATVAAPDPAPRYRLVALGFEAAQQSTDDANPRDGNGDEVYFAAVVNRTVLTRSPLPTTRGANVSIVMTRSHGDEAVSVPYGRIRAGTASATGGIKSGDVVPAGLDINASTSAVQVGQFPHLVWEGVLQGDDAVIVHPTMWEDDVNPRIQAMWSKAVIDRAAVGYVSNSALRIAALIDGRTVYMPNATALGGPLITCFDMVYGYIPCNADPGDRPIGWNSIGWYDEVILLTRTTVEGQLMGGVSASNRPTGQPGTFEVPFLDSGNRAKYYLFLRVERVP